MKYGLIKYKCSLMMVQKGYLIIFLLWYHVKYLNTSLHLI